MIPYCQVSAFTETPGHGNQAGVILNAEHLSATQMQGLAAHLGVPETVFVTDIAGNDVRVRYYTPRQEIEFCGHATVALGLVLAQNGLWRDRHVNVETMIGRIPLELESQQGVPKRVWMTQRNLELRDIDRTYRKRIANALGIDERLIHRGLPTISASTGLWTAFVPIVDPFIVDAIEPHYADIEALSQELGVTGIHPYAPMSPDTLYTRDFSPAVGIPEDPVTGSSSGALVALLAAAGALPRRGSTVRGYCLQGHAMNSPGEVVVDVTLQGDTPACVKVGGCAVIEHEGKL